MLKKKRHRYGAGSRIFTAMLTIAMLITTLPPAAFAAGNRSSGSIDDMTVLDALGIDTSVAPSGFDENDPSNPYGQDQTTMAVVDELLAVSGKTGTLYGHNSPVLGDDSAILKSGKNSAIAGKVITTPESNSEETYPDHNPPSGTGNTYYDADFSDSMKSKRYNFYHQESWLESPWSVAVEGNFSTDNDGQKKQTAILYAIPARQRGYGWSSDGNIYEQALKLNLNITSPENGTHSSIYTNQGTTAMSKGDLLESITINQNGGNMGELTDANLAKMKQIMQFKNAATVMNHLKLTAGDFDGDGIDEIAFYTPFYDSGDTANYPSILVYDLQEMDGSKCFDKDSWKVSRVINLERWKSNTEYPYEYDIAPNMVSLSAADFDRDGTDDLAVSYGYYGTYGEHPTKASVYLGGRAGEMLSQSIPLTLGNVFRTGLATGDVDGDSYNELVVGGSVRNSTDKVRYVGIYEWNGNGFVLSSEKNIDIFKQENGSYIYDAAKQRNSAKKGDYYYTSPAASANVAVGKFNGLSEPACVYIDGLIIELGDSGLTLSRMVDDQLGTTSFSTIELNARAVDINGDGTDQVVVSYIKSTSAVTPNSKNFNDYIKFLKDISAANSNKVSTTVVGVQSSLKSWDGIFAAPDTDNDTTLLTYSKQHYYTYSDPEILAVLASPPYFGDLEQDEFETVDPNSTTYGSSKGSGGGSSYSNSFSAGLYTSWEHEVKFLGVTLFSTEVETEINNHFTWETEQVSSMEYSAEYQTYAGQDTVVLYAVPVETYVYSAKIPVTKANGTFDYYDTQTMTVNIPHEPTIKTLTLDDYESIAKDYDELPAIADNLLTHTAGEPASYPSSVSQIPAASFLTTGQPTLVAPSFGEPAPSTGYSTASQTRSIEMTSETSNSFNYEIEVNTKAGVGAGGVTVGVTAGYSHGTGSVHITTSGSSYSGTIFDIPKAAQDYGYGFTWRLCAFPGQTSEGKVFPVVTYLVTEVQQPSRLPEEFTQSEDGTTQDQIALTWDDANNPAGYMIYRYFRSAGAADFYEVAFVSSSDPENYEYINGVRHYKYIDTGLSSDTEYQYRIQTISASNGTRSVPSEIITAYTKPAGKIPVVSVSPTAVTAYPDTPTTLTAFLENEDALSGAKISYQWQKLGDDGRTWENLIGSTAKQNSFVIRNAGQDDAGFYRCRVTSQQDQTIVSSYTEKAEVTYSKQAAVIKDFKISNGKASVRVAGAATNSIPTGVVVFTLTGAGFSKDIAVNVDSSGRASAELSAARGIYKVTATYNGSRVFGSASADADENGQPVFFVSGNVASSGTTYLNMESSYEYGDRLNIHEYTINSNGTAVDNGEIDYSKADFGRYFNIEYSIYDSNNDPRYYSRNAVLKFDDTGDELTDGSIWWAQYVSSADGQTYDIMKDAVLERFRSGYAAFAGKIVMYYDNNFYTFDVSRKDATVKIDFSDLPDSIPYKDAAQLLSNGKFNSTDSSNYMRNIVQDRTVLTGQPDFAKARSYGTDYDIMFSALSGALWYGLQDDSSHFIRLDYADYYPLKEGSLYAPYLYHKVPDYRGGYSLKANKAYGFYDINSNYGVKFNVSDSDYLDVSRASYLVSVYDCYNFTIIPDSVNIVANTYDVKMTAEKTGGQTSGTIALVSPSSSLPSFPAGTTLVFSAQPYDGYTVDRWEVNGNVVEGNSSNRLTVTQTVDGTDVHVFFKVQQNTLTYSASPENAGSIECTSAGIPIGSGSVPTQGAPLTFKATAAEGWHFTGWEYFPEGASAEYPTDDTFTVKMPGSSVRLYARFARDAYKLDLSENLAAYDADGKPVSDTSKITGDSVVTVKPASGYKLIENASWNVIGSSYENVNDADLNAGIKITMTADTSVTADVAAGAYNIALTQADVGGHAEASATGLLAGGTDVTFVASAARGYEFAGWSDGNDIVSKDASYTFTVASDITLTPVFKAQAGRTLALSSGGNGMFQWHIDGVSEDAYDDVLTLYPGETADITAIPDNGYIVAGWTENGIYSDIDDTVMSYSYSSLLKDGSTLRVIFKPVMNHIVKFADNITATLNGSQISSGNVVADGSTVIFRYNGPKVVNSWKNGDETVSGRSVSYTVRDLSSDIDISAVLSAEDGEICTVTANYPNEYASIVYDYPLGNGGLKGTGVAVRITPRDPDSYPIVSVSTDKDWAVFEDQDGTWVWKTKSLDDDLTVNVRTSSFIDIVVQDGIEHGTVEVSADRALSYDSILIYPKAENGYMLDILKMDGSTLYSSDFEYQYYKGSIPYKYTIPSYVFGNKLTIEATFKEISEGEFTITFNENYGDKHEFTGHTYKDGKFESASSIPTLSRAGYIFDGWFDTADGGNEITADTVFTDHTTVYAHWSEDPDADDNDGHSVITADCDGGTVEVFPSKAHKGDTVLLSAAADEGYIFSEFTVTDGSGDAVAVDGDSFVMPDSDVTVSAVFEPDRATAYRVRFDANGGTPSLIQKQVGAGGKIANFPADPSLEGYSFDGWFTSKTGGAEVTAATKFTRNMTVYAHWTEIKFFTLTFNTNGGSDIEAITEKEGSVIDISKLVPEKSGFTFTGWFTDNELTDKAGDSMILTGDITLYAGWSDMPVINSFTVTFNTNGGSEIAAVTDIEGSVIDISKLVPQRSGYTFNGWFTDSKLTDKAGDSITLTGDITLYAGWTRNSSGGGGGGSSSGGSSGGSTTPVTPVTPVGPTPGTSESTAEIGNVTDFSGKKLDTVTDKNGSVTVKTGSDKDTVVIAEIKNAGPGTAAYIVKADGAEELVRDSVVLNGRLYMRVPDGAVIKAVDRSTKFTDVDDALWSSYAIAFVSGHGLFNGTSADKFSPAAAMTREMLMTVIARLNGADTSGDALSRGMAWAVENGISDGSDPKGLITREQIATMLYRNAGEPEVTYDSSYLAKFSDASEISGYAEKAMLWAAETGIINGTTDNRLMPRANATREQVAQMMFNYVSSLYR